MGGSFFSGRGFRCPLPFLDGQHSAPSIKVGPHSEVGKGLSFFFAPPSSLYFECWIAANQRCPPFPSSCFFCLAKRQSGWGSGCKEPAYTLKGFHQGIDVITNEQVLLCSFFCSSFVVSSVAWASLHCSGNPLLLVCCHSPISIRICLWYAPHPLLSGFVLLYFA